MPNAKYKKKKKTDDGNVIYEYSDDQIKKRHKEKAERLQKLNKSIEDLRKKVKKDLGADDTKTRMKALAVALMDETYSRVGNHDSAKDGHFGTTTWRKKHVTFSKGKATIKYVGKSGVDQEKTVKDSKVIKVLKEMTDNLGADDLIFECEGDDDSVCVRAQDVNDYLSEFDITAKDIRGLHANKLMQDALEKVRKGGKKLPDDKKEREKILKEEFKKALEIVSDDVGHEANTLKTNYLVPGLEESYMKDGTVIKKLDKKSNLSPARRVTLAKVIAKAYLGT